MTKAARRAIAIELYRDLAQSDPEQLIDFFPAWSRFSAARCEGREAARRIDPSPAEPGDPASIPQPTGGRDEMIEATMSDTVYRVFCRAPGLAFLGVRSRLVGRGPSCYYEMCVLLPEDAPQPTGAENATANAVFGRGPEPAGITYQPAEMSRWRLAWPGHYVPA